MAQGGTQVVGNIGMYLPPSDADFAKSARHIIPIAIMQHWHRRRRLR